jgi:hypothetical protein
MQMVHGLARAASVIGQEAVTAFYPLVGRQFGGGQLDVHKQSGIVLRASA